MKCKIIPTAAIKLRCHNMEMVKHFLNDSIWIGNVVQRTMPKILGNFVVHRILIFEIAGISDEK